METGFIDWTKDDLNLYVFKKQGGQYNLTDIQSIPLEGNLKLKPETLAKLKITDIENIHLSIPSELLTLREVDFPFTDRAKIRDTISYELEGLLLGSTGDYSIDHIVTGSSENSSRVLAVCMEKTELRKIIDMFSSAGIEPKVISSIDLSLAGGEVEKLLDTLGGNREIRIEAAKKELLNPSINFRQDELAYTGDIERLIKGLKFTAVLILILLILLGTFSYLRLYSAKKEYSFLTEEMHNLYRSVFPEDKKIIDAERQFKGNLNTLKKKKAVLVGIPVLDILREIAALKNDSITLHEFSSDGKNILIKGVALSFQDVELFKNSLSTSFDTVRVIDSKASADEKIDFTIIMKEKSV
jgi:type II secretory pathway component PulL